MEVELLSPLPDVACGSCCIYSANHHIFGSVVAKVWTVNSDELPSQYITEPLLQGKLQHKNVCGLLDAVLIAGERQSQWVLCFERHETDLQRDIQRRVQNSQSFSEAELWSFLVDMTDALAYAQRKVSTMQHIAHRDIKPSNILIAANGDYQLADFGEAKMCANETRQESVAGTKGYLSPLLRQVIVSKQWTVTHNPFRSDVFSFGLTVLSMACLRVFKSGDCYEEAVKLIDGLAYSDSLKSVLRSTLKEDESERPDFIALKEIVSKWKANAAKDTDDSARASVFGCFPGFYERVCRLLREVASELFSMWKLSSPDSTPVLRFYCKRQELLDCLSNFAGYATKHMISTYEFEYIPVSQLISQFSDKSVLTIEQKTAETFTELQSLTVPNCIYPITSPENQVKFFVRKSGSVVTVSEPPSQWFSLAVQLPPSQGRQLLQGQVYNLGTLVLKVVEVSAKEVVIGCGPASNSFEYRICAGEGEVTIGRDPTNRVSFAVCGLSKVHAVVKCEQGVWTITDLQSRNGLWLYAHMTHSMHRQSNEVRVEEGATISWNTDKYRFRIEGS